MWTVRRYQPSDRSAVRQLAGDTACFGDPIEKFFTARELFLDAFATYYTDVASSYLWLAEDNGTVIGYLMGCADTHDYNVWYHANIKRVAWRAVTLRYRGLFNRMTIDYIRRHLRLRVPYLDLSAYPAHLHINTRADKRGNGVGAALMNVYLDQLRNENISGLHLETTGENTIAVPWYEKLGFQLLQRSPTDLYQASVGHSVDLLLYGMRL
jgi:ribosomal protein S18 acetylase RimI-like enzyme